MKLLISITIIMIITMISFYRYIIRQQVIQYKERKDRKYQSKEIILLFVILGSALLLRMVLSYFNHGFDSDMSCFISWADMVYKDGMSQFYLSELFTDYPPGYMYILYVVGAIRNLFQLEHYSNTYEMIVKLPACLFDVAAGGFIYFVAKKHFKQIGAFCCVCLYLFHPAIIINSSIWGQVDAVYTLFILLMCYFITEKKLIPSYFIFAIAILIKPQAIMFAPVLLYGIIDQIFLENFSWKRVYKNLLSGIAAIMLLILLAMPFGLGEVIKQYTSTITSYPYATINAYNIWMFFGKNWSEQTNLFFGISYQIWGYLSIALIVLYTLYISLKHKHEVAKYYYTAALLLLGIFTFSVRMHERYLYPSIILFLFAYLKKPRKELFFIFLGCSTVQFLNVAHVFYFSDAISGSYPIVVSFFTVVLLFYAMVIGFRFSKLEVKQESSYFSNIEKINFFGKETSIIPSKVFSKLTKIDFIIIVAITGIYSAIALYDLGNREMPQTQWESLQVDDMFALDMGKNRNIEKISYFLGNYENRQFKIQEADTIDGPWTEVGEIEMSSVFAWGSTELSISKQYIRFLSLSDRSVVREIVFLDSEDNVVEPVAYTEGAEVLFDEQRMYPKRSTFRDSTYFDEIYHARTAYEYINGLYSYENTHPPLGKIFIAIGMLLFGVNPFGWRIMGTIFGIAMVPSIYLFGKRLTNRTSLATVVCLLFTFDFMHFTQTRIATIDVFVTFFIILMYYFMYKYYSISFYDTEFKKTLTLLGLSGVMMGFGVASKWTGIYAGAGLGILFFMTLYKRYQEYCYAKQNPRETTEGIAHETIIKVFPVYTKKTILFCCLFFICIPALIYALSYLPFQDGSGAGWFSMMLKNQNTMLSYHSHVDATHPYSSWWYQWPTIYRPIWYYSGHVTETISEGISSFGNPLVWWMGIIAFFFMIYLAIRKKDKIAWFLIIAYLAQYVPWFLVTRITFIYHYFPSVPFVTLMILYAIYEITKKYKIAKYGVIIYVVAVVALFFLFYPVLAGMPIDKNFVSTWLRWFHTWVLVS